MTKRRYNTWREREDRVIEISLTKGKIALVDKADLEKVLCWKWHVCSHGGERWYAYTTIRLSPYKSTTLRMHRVILEPPTKMNIDHINHDGLDNRRCNLRCVTYSQNNVNRIKKAKATSRFKGVRLDKRDGKWQARLGINGKQICLGNFSEEIDAAHAYNKAAHKQWGEFALLNPI